VALVGWRWLLVRWTRTAMAPMAAAVEALESDLEALESTAATGSRPAAQAQAALEKILEEAQGDPPVWEDWNPLMQRAQAVIVAVAKAYHPEIKYPLLNIYIPQVYELLRGTVDDMDRWMASISPVLGKVTVGQAVQAYETYQKWEPSARKLIQAWNWAQWVINPAVAAARTLSSGHSAQANQQLIANLNQLLREKILRQLFQQAVVLYGGELRGDLIPQLEASRVEGRTQTLQQILEQARPVEPVAQRPLNILLIGRTGAGKSSLVNTLFDTDKAEVDLLPSTETIQSYRWQADSGEALTLIDSPGYEQSKQADFRQQVLDYARQADLLLLATPALDPALQMDAALLEDMRREVRDLGVVAAVTQVDRLRPIREWSPPYDWQQGDRPKEKSIRDATLYRQEQLGRFCERVLPVVTANAQMDRRAWNADALSQALIELIEPTQELKLARFLSDRRAKINAAARIIDRYSYQLTTTQGVTAMLKSPVLQFISTLTTGSPALAQVLIQKIPVEQLPLVVGKLQMAYDLFQLLASDPENEISFDLQKLWPVFLANNHIAPDRNAWALGHALVEYWSQGLNLDQLQQRFDQYCDRESEPGRK
ncbi:GTPase, partial [filamentous cyanobacterium CCP5]